MILREFHEKIADALIRKITGTDIGQWLCHQAFRADAIKDLPLYGELHRFIVILSIFEGARVKQIDVNHFPHQRDF